MKFKTIVAAASSLALGGMLLVPFTAQAAPGDQTNAFVCKYVGKPGVDERL